MLFHLSRISSVHTLEWVLSQVLQESAAAVAQRYLGLGPSKQRLPQFVADVAHVTATLYSMTQVWVCGCVGGGGCMRGGGALPTP